MLHGHACVDTGRVQPSPHILFLGPPASGKGTHAKRLARELGVPHVAAGDLLRQAVTLGTEAGVRAGAYMQAGTLVPDGVVARLLVERLRAHDAQRGFVLDGFPRTVEQAKVLEEHLGRRCLDVILVLDVDAQELVERVAGRRSCPQGHVFHITHNPPRVADVCDYDGERLVQRPDDTEAVVRQRLAVYEQQTSPLAGFYERSCRIEMIDAAGTPDEVYARVRSAAYRVLEEHADDPR